MPELPSELPEMLRRIVVAAVLGGLIGLERDIRGRAAGLRTHLLVSLGAAVFMILSLLVAASAKQGFAPVDPGRIAAQIVAGIGFLCAGVIIKEGATVRGLTTAACLWSAAAIGMTVGAGYYLFSVAITGLSLACLILLKYSERVYLKDSYRVLRITTPINVEAADVIPVVKGQDLSVINCEIERDYDVGVNITRLTIRLFHKGATDKHAHAIVSALEESKIQLKHLEWTRT